MAVAKKKAEAHNHLTPKEEASYIKFIKEIGAGKRRGFVLVLESTVEDDASLHTFGHKVTKQEMNAVISSLIQTVNPEMALIKGLLGGIGGLLEAAMKEEEAPKKKTAKK